MSFIEIFQQWFKRAQADECCPPEAEKKSLSNLTTEEGQLIQLYATAREGKSFDREPESYDEALKLLEEVRNLKIDLTGVNWSTIDFSDIHHHRTVEERDRLQKAKKIISESYLS
ncbi:MAG: hypothetical protein KBC26_00210 [Candidatus Pacebacteria bacterium]|nr:hypothetical protein [Candidatus Paceibacterota bacterium]